MDQLNKNKTIRYQINSSPNDDIISAEIQCRKRTWSTAVVSSVIYPHCLFLNVSEQ